MNVLGKIFNSLLRNKLEEWANEHKILTPSQFGFRPGFRTTDAAFVLHSAIQKQLLKKKKLFACFVDFKKAFDTIPHHKLWQRLLEIGVNHKIIRILRSMYAKCKGKVLTSQGLSESFPIGCGVRQGCNLSPLLFSLYINSLPNNMPAFVIQERSTACLMFADDIVLLANNPDTLQAQLNCLNHYCTQSSLNVNTIKTKIIVFSAKPCRHLHKWTFGDKQIDQVDTFKYLGTWFHCNGKFNFAISKLFTAATQSTNGLIRKIIENQITDTEIQISLFQSLVVPKLLYHCELWGLHKINALDRVCLRFYKFCLKLPPSAPNSAVYGEIGLPSLKCSILYNIAKYWSRIHLVDCPPLVSDALALQIDLSSKQLNSWANMWTCKLLKCFGLQSSPYDGFPEVVKRVYDIFIQEWQAELNYSPKLRTYNLFKHILKREKYLSVIKSVKLRNSLARFRTSCHNLEIEVGRHSYPSIPANERLCRVCACNTVEDEIHLLLHCQGYAQERADFLNSIELHHPYFQHLNMMDKFEYLMSSDNNQVINKLAKFISVCMNKRFHALYTTNY